jgi:hypothetical protein
VFNTLIPRPRNQRLSEITSASMLNFEKLQPSVLIPAAFAL